LVITLRRAAGNEIARAVAHGVVALLADPAGFHQPAPRLLSRRVSRVAANRHRVRFWLAGNFIGAVRVANEQPVSFFGIRRADLLAPDDAPMWILRLVFVVLLQALAGFLPIVLLSHILPAMP